ncbi:hypothetical protein ACK31G_01585 [Aeromonas caviae]
MAISDYLKGSGSNTDPYVIHSIAAAVQFFSVDIFRVGVFASLVTDLDLSAFTFSQVSSALATLNGNGYAIDNLKHLYGNTHAVTFNQLTLRNFYWGHVNGNYFGSSAFNDVAFIDGRLGHTSGTSTYTRCTMSGVNWFKTGTGLTGVSSVVLPISVTCPTAFTDLRSVADPYNPNRYPNYDPARWTIDGASPPRLLKQDVSHLRRGYLVKGQVKTGGSPKPRFVRALSVADFARINDTMAAADGSFSLPCGFYSDVVMVATYEPYGAPLVASKAYVLGEIIHPATPNGFRYLCTTAGNSGATLPPEPWSTTSPLTVGTALFTPDPVFQPQLHGPIKPVLCDLITGLPV